MDSPVPSNKVAIIKNIYLYLVSFVALMIIVFSTGGILNLVLRTWIFPKADRAYYGAPMVCAPGETPTTTDRSGMYKEPCVTEDQAKNQEEMRTAQRQQELVRNLSMILVAVPVFAYHWRIIRKREEI